MIDDDTGSAGAWQPRECPSPKALDPPARLLAPFGDDTLSSGCLLVPARTRTVAASIDGLLAGATWVGGTVAGSFPSTMAPSVTDPSGGGEQNCGFSPVSAQQASDMRAILAGTPNRGGAAYESCANISVTGVISAPGLADTRVAIPSLDNPTA